jgi:glycosyltransferase involved in cell wall biosynthesis
MHLIITGDGPDRGRLEALIHLLGLQRQITLLPWQEDSTLVYSALDLLIIPSRFEGVPLVMLEALACGTPVIGSARDGMKDLLPVSWTFETENGGALTEAAVYVSTQWKNDLPALQARVRNEYTIEKFQQNFEAALRRFLIMGR